MAKGSLAGMTDYNHQSFLDIIDDLESERQRAIDFRDRIQQDINVLTTNEYWNNNVPFDFKNIVGYSLRHFNTVISEFEDIPKDLNIEVEEHHITRLNKVATVSQEINERIGRIWHQEYDNKDYGDDNFILVENIYADTRDMAVNLLDIANLSERLTDFIGRKGNRMKTNNPWISGSFYLVLAITIISGLGVLSNVVNWYLLPIILIGGILIIVIVGILQLRNDDRLSDRSFVTLIKETFKRIPLLNQIRQNQK